LPEKLATPAHSSDRSPAALFRILVYSETSKLNTRTYSASTIFVATKLLIIIVAMPAKPAKKLGPSKPPELGSSKTTAQDAVTVPVGNAPKPNRNSSCPKFGSLTNYTKPDSEVASSVDNLMKMPEKSSRSKRVKFSTSSKKPDHEDDSPDEFQPKTTKTSRRSTRTESSRKPDSEDVSSDEFQPKTAKTSKRSNTANSSKSKNGPHDEVSGLGETPTRSNKKSGPSKLVDSSNSKKRPHNAVGDSVENPTKPKKLKSSTDPEIVDTIIGSLHDLALNVDDHSWQKIWQAFMEAQTAREAMKKRMAVDKARVIIDKFKASSAKTPKSEPTLAGLPEQILTAILERVLLREGGDICPVYPAGMQPHPWTNKMRCRYFLGSDPTANIISNPIPPKPDLGLLLVNRRFNELAAKIFFNNKFVFNDARSCDWFLRLIGNKNVGLLRHMAFNLSSGFILSKEHRSCFDICEEELWIDVFNFLKQRHQLHEIKVRLYEWNSLESRDNLSDDDKETLTYARRQLCHVLPGFRGVEKATMVNHRCTYLGLAERKEIVEAMVKPKEDGAPTAKERSVETIRVLGITNKNYKEVGWGDKHLWHNPETTTTYVCSKINGEVSQCHCKEAWEDHLNIIRVPSDMFFGWDFVPPAEPVLVVPKKAHKYFVDKMGWAWMDKSEQDGIPEEQ
jgi:hypothetical protein